jgi:transposase-like protein
MNHSAYREFFLKPTETWHRRYEALRACFVEQQPLAEVARRFGVSYGTVCNWVSQFRSEQDAGQRSPFFFAPSAGAR